MPIILDKVNYCYSADSAYKVQALKDIDLKIEDGQFIGIIGHTGSGKSTLVQHLNGLLKATSGHIYYNGEDIYDEDYDLRQLRNKVGMVFQYPEHQLFETTNFEDVCFGPKNQGLDRKTVELRAYEALQNVHFPEDLYYQPPFDLSGGQKRRVAIAGVLAMHPEVLILDEPTVGLDPKQIIEIRELIKKLGENHTVILSSHILTEISAVCDHIFIISKGKLVASDATENLINLMSTEQNIDIIAKCDEAVARQVIENVSDVKEVKFEQPEEDDTVKFVVRAQKGCDIREGLFKAFCDRNITLLEMHSAVKSLEDVFLELTGEGETE